jgi:hypothetical protein
MSKLKRILGEIPYTAELYWRLRQRDSETTVGLNLSRLKSNLPGWVEAAANARKSAPAGKKVLVFGMIHYWIEYCALLSTALAGMGHDVTLATLPYAHWRKPENNFDLRRQDQYIRGTLKAAAPLIKVVSLFRTQQPAHNALPADLIENLRSRALRDTQYSLLTEEVEMGSELYDRRLVRDRLALESALALLQAEPVDVVITPNGSILEFGALFEAARRLGIPISTFEFGEQNYRMWLAQNDDVMRQDTGALWQARGRTPLSDGEWERVRTMFSARQGARSWDTFERQWQTAESQGAQQLRQDLGLDDRPLAFLPTNVLGDSLTLGRQIFIGMTEWVRRTIRWFGDHPEYQLVVRVHPGEQIGWGPSTYDLLRESFPKFPPNVRVLPADYKVNSYDLVDAARLGLVYTTTMGLEMAMLGLPVIVSGQTHYRGKGFTHDPDDWASYETALAAALQETDRFAPDESQVTLAWTYAYRFFFEYPQPFPWHIQHFAECLEQWPLERLLSEEGMAAFGETFDYLLCEKGLFETKIADRRSQIADRKSQIANRRPDI